MTVHEFIKEKPALIFDLFHTLTGTLYSLDNPPKTKKKYPYTSEFLNIDSNAWNDQLLKYSHDRLVGKLRDPYEIIKMMALAINPNIPDELIRQATENRLKSFEYELMSIPEENIEVLKKLKSMGKKLALCSNADAGEAKAFPDCPIAPYFDEIIISCDVGYAKPDKEIYELTLKRLGTSPKESVFIGDGGSDELPGARNAGLSTILMAGIVRPVRPDLIELRENDADYIIENMKELIE